MMQRMLIALYRLVPLWGLYGVMAVVVVFYMLLSRRSYRAVHAYYRQIWGYGRRATLWRVYVSHFRFGQVVLDRFAVYAGKHFRLDISGNDHFMAAAGSKEGALILGSHTGNFELCGYTLHSTEKRLNAVVFGGESQTINDNRRRLWQGHNIGTIPVTGDMSHLFAIHRALSDGEMVCMTADRALGSNKSLTFNFLGRPADFPIGPFAVAASEGVTVLGIFVMKESLRTYHVEVRPLRLTEEEQHLPRRKQIEAYARHYVALLEEMVRKYPDQWFNYYNFWKQ